MDLALDDAVILVTGGSSGLGLACAHRLVAEGARIVICGRDQQRLNEAVESFDDNRDRVTALVADVSTASGVASLLDEISTRFGRLDGLVSNAGASAATTVEASSDEAWQADLDLKLFAALRLARGAITLLRKSEHPAIVTVLAFAAKAPTAGSSPSSVTRAAGMALTKVLANELSPEGIRVNAVLPGLIESGQWERRAHEASVELDDIYRALLEHNKVPLGRFGRSEEFADVVAWLVSPRASYVTGTAINVDGGLSPVV